jgi:hypothetical protein
MYQIMTVRLLDYTFCIYRIRMYYALSCRGLAGRFRHNLSRANTIGRRVTRKRIAKVPGTGRSRLFALLRNEV